MATPFDYLLCFLFISGLIGVHGSIFRPEKLFVFGDSYADTGNVRKSLGHSWDRPYGITDPGKPAGRFSDGLILTDYLAKFLRLKSPLGYIWRDYVPNDFYNGMNFAFGGSGVFYTNPRLPNMTTQIGYFEQLLNTSFYTRRDVESAAVLVTLAGNDYAAYLDRGGSISEVGKIVPGVVNQLVENLRSLQRLGLKKILVGGLQPLGCLPRFTRITGYQQCIQVQNFAVGYHNALLRQAVEQLNSESIIPRFLLLDLNQAFETVIANRTDYRGNLRFATPLTPCCAGIGSGNSCASVAENGTRLYKLCSDPSAAFFWDDAHPTQAGWKTVFALLKTSVEQFFRV